MTKPAVPSLPRAIARRAARVFDDQPDDPFMATRKYPDATPCGVCGSVYRGGRWQLEPRTDSPLKAAATCPACRRIAEHLPAGRLTLSGKYVDAHRDELLRIVHNVASRESSEHPLNRIMSIDVLDDRIDICTTDVHLPRRIGRALKRAHDGELSIAFLKDACEIDVGWRR